MIFKGKKLTSGSDPLTFFFDVALSTVFLSVDCRLLTPILLLSTVLFKVELRLLTLNLLQQYSVTRW